MTATACSQCGQVLSPLAQDPATVIAPLDDQEPVAEDVSEAAEQTPPDSATAIFALEDEVPAAEELISAPAETPRDAPTAIIPPEEAAGVAAAEEAPGAEVPSDKELEGQVASPHFTPPPLDADAPYSPFSDAERGQAEPSEAVGEENRRNAQRFPEVTEEAGGPEAPVAAVEERPLPPELAPLEGIAPPGARPAPPAGHTPPGGMTTPFPPEEIEAEARLPYEDTDRRETPPVAVTQPRVHEPAPGPRESITPRHLRVEPPPRTPPVTPPPPAFIAPPAPVYSPPPVAAPLAPGLAYLQQRVGDYLRGGYRLHQRTATAAVLSRGKALGAGGWLLALLTGIGLAWYLLLLLFSGLRADRVYITLESDGLVYEDGPGAAHVRRGRARAGRRWALFGAVVFALSLVLALTLGAIAAVYLRSDTNQAALREAYPAITLFEEHFSAVEAHPDDVALARDGFVAWVILTGVAVVSMWGGATLFVVGTIHHGAFRVSVLPLPGWG